MTSSIVVGLDATPLYNSELTEAMDRMERPPTMVLRLSRGPR
jgi:hypothetical protein